MILASLMVAGCAGMWHSESVDGDSLVGTYWQVESVDSGGIIDNSMITVSFPEQGRIAGSTGCNRFMGNFVVSDKGKVSVSGLGSTPLLEQYIFYADVLRILESKGIGVYRPYVGNYFTSLEMMGATVTLMRLDDELKGCLDLEADSMGLRQLPA